MHATHTPTRAAGTPAYVMQEGTIGPSEEREPLAPDAGLVEDEVQADDGTRADWCARPELLRRRGRRGPDPDPGQDSGIRLRRERRVFAPFSALPSLARPTPDLRSRRR